MFGRDRERDLVVVQEIARRRVWADTLAPSLRAWWGRFGRLALLAAIAYMAVTAFLRLRFAFRALTTMAFGGHDLRYRFDEVTRWFAGLPVYGAITNADYPPAAYVTLWPLLGWTTIQEARWLWAVSAAVSLIVIAFLTARESTGQGGLERLFIALLVFPMYGTQMTVWVGQLAAHVLALLLVGLILIRRPAAPWWSDTLAAVLLVVALVKPTISLPFLWMVLFLPGRVRPIWLVSIGYIALTFIAAVPRQESVLTLLREWLTGRTGVMPVQSGHANVHKWLALAGWESVMLPASLVAAVLVGVWIWRHRTADFWMTLAVATLVSRVWFHHWAYDDILLLVPMIALYRHSKRGPAVDGSDVAAAILFTGILAVSLFPYRFFEFDRTPSPLVTVLMEIVQTSLWLATLGFLLRQAAQDRGTVSMQPVAASG